MNYTTSKDYELLWNLVQEGKEVVCWADFCNYGDKMQRDICRTRKIENISLVLSRGIHYAYAENKEEFMGQCKKNNLAFLPLDEWIKIEKPEDVPQGERLLFYNCQDKTVMEGILSYSCVYSAEPAISIKNFSHYKPLPEPPRE